ncbi:glycosyltransferase family 9 protein [Motiliproteus coralliicola]|uniref:glycosyltransferase family 9 protein n=1 Tax=Motiliproteus coralliicola TaxID=2283196 RepID=UPI00269A7324
MNPSTNSSTTCADQTLKISPLLGRAPESICVLRLSALGDICNTLPAVRALQRQWPDCRITWIVGKVEAMMLDGIDGVELLVYDKRSGFKGMLELRKKLKGRRFDLLLHMQAALRASLLSLCIPARIRLGFDAERAKDNQRLFTNRQIAPNPRKHVLDGFMDFIRACGADAESLEWRMPIPDQDREQARRLVGEQRYLVISPCSSQRIRNFRNWSVEGYAEVIDHAWQQYGLRTVLSGGNTELEQHYGERLGELCSATPINLIGKTSLKELLALIEGAELVLGPDSGPMHMGTATGTPALGLYASSNPDRTGPYLSRQWVVNAYPAQVQKAFGCEVDSISWGKRVREPDVMDSIQVSEVTAMMDRLLAERSA